LKAEWKEAKKVTLAPVTKNIHIYAPSESLRAIFHNRTVSKGDIISTTSVRRPRESFGTDVMFEQVFPEFFGGSFGLGEIKLHVYSTSPGGIVKITDVTEMDLLPEAVDLPAELPEVMYEDLGGIKPALSKIREIIELPLKHPELFTGWVLMRQKECFFTALQEQEKPCLQKRWPTRAKHIL